MLRTQISLTEAERRALDEAAARTGKSISALIRDAVDRVYGVERSTEADLASLRRAFGAWEDRGLDGMTFVDQMRSGQRFER